MSIKPASNNQLKNWKKLQMRKYRKKTGLFLAEGMRCVEQILENGRVNVQEFIIQKGWNPEQISFKNDLSMYEVEASDFESVSDTETPQGIIAVCNVPKECEPNTLSKKEGIIVAADGLQDPGNLGTIIRTACWFDVAGILIGSGTVDPFHPKVVRSTAGATGVLPYITGDLKELLEYFEKENRATFLLNAGESSNKLRDISPPKKSILVVGNEGNGINANLFAKNRQTIRIEGNNAQVESLNAAIALSISLYYFFPK